MQEPQRLAEADAATASGSAALQQAFNAISCGVLVVGPDGLIELANAKAHQMFGYADGALMQLDVDLLLPATLRGAHVRQRAGFFARPIARRLTERLNLEGHRRDGSRFPVAISVNLLATDNGPRALATVLDASALHDRAEQDSRVAAIVASSTDAIVGKDLDGVITSWNPAAERIFGYSAAQAIGRPASMLYPPEMMSEEIELLERIRRGDNVSSRQTRQVHKSGTAIDMSISLAPIHGKDGQVMGAAMIARDITAQCAMQRDAERLAALRAAILDNVSYSVITTTPEGVITSFNRAAERMLGYRAEEVIGVFTPMIFRDPAEIAARAQAFSTATGTPLLAGFEFIVAAARGGESVEQEWTYVRKDGTRFPAHLSITAMRERDGAISGFLGILSDISQQRAAEAAAAREAEKLRTILDNSLDGIHVIDTEGQLAFYSKSFACALGRTDEQMVGLGISDWDRQACPDDVRNNIASLMDRTRTFEAVHQRVDGSQFDVEVSIKGIQLGGRPYLHATSRDITERKRVEQERRRYLLELERTNRELDEFVSVASHDLRAPLRAASSLAQWIVEDNPETDQLTRERLGMIQSRMRRMSRLLDDIQQYARVGRSPGVRTERLSAVGLLRQVLAMLEVPAQMRVVLTDSLESVIVPRMPLQQIFVNLIDNAIKHHDRPAGTVTVAVTYLAGNLYFTVTDDGPGIPDEYREEIFEMFRTLRPRDEVEGSGMGLALVRKIVTQAGGRCGVEPAPIRGSRFWLEWPDRASDREARA